jgi:hypothetical protein
MQPALKSPLLAFVLFVTRLQAQLYSDEVQADIVRNFTISTWSSFVQKATSMLLSTKR